MLSLHNETGKYAISIQTTLAQDISHVMSDGVQLQQVLMNLIVNSIEAMKDVEDGTREVAIKSASGQAATYGVGQ